MSRREFVRGTAALGGALAAGALPAGTLPTAAAPASAREAGMPYRTLGSTGLGVSEIGFGGYPIDDPDVILYALDRGINYIDTSNCYRGGASERTIGEALKGRRDRFIVTTKWCPHHVGRPAKKQVFLDQLDASLKRLQTDHVDIVLNHEVGRNSDGRGLERLKNPEILEAFEAARRAGKVRFMGASGHDPDLMDVMHHAVDSGAFSVLLCRYSFLDYPDQDRLIARAAGKGVGFVAMKTLAGAKGADLEKFKDRHVTFRQAALRWVLSNRKVSNLVISINSRKQVDEYAAAADRPLTRADLDILREYAEKFSTQVCRFSGACMEACPEDVRIADILRFSMYYHEYGQENRAVESYARLVASERAAHCLHCSGFCERACAYDLPIRTLMIRAHDTLSDTALSPGPGPREEDPSRGRISEGG
jgi:predicted aldo/keto reductase-like oxidoreductase